LYSSCIVYTLLIHYYVCVYISPLIFKGTSGNKRRPTRDAAERGSKMMRLDVSDSESSEHEADSDFEAEESDDSDQSASDEDADDYNPFGGSDNEDPWCRSSKTSRAKSKSHKLVTVSYKTVHD